MNTYNRKKHIMNPLGILLLMAQIFRVKTTIYELFDIVEESDRKYFQLIEITAEILNENASNSSSNYIAIIGAINENHISDKVLMKISTAISSPFYVHGLARNTIIFARNFSDILIEENFDHIHRRGRMVICVTKLYTKEIEFFEEFEKAASYLWANRFSRIIFITWIEKELNIFGIRLYDEETCFPTELVKIATVQDGRMLKSRPEFYEEIKNLNACPLRIITTTGMPYAETYVENNVTRVKGIEGNILNVLSNRMNFTALISDTEKLLFDSRFNDSKDMLRSNKSDLCFSGKKINFQKIEPTVSIMDCQKVWIVPKSGLVAPWMQVIIPFEKSLWTILVSTLFIVGSMCLILGKKSLSLINMWSLFLGVSIETKNATEEGAGLVKMLFGIWIFFSYVITRSYLAALEGYLTRPTFLSEIDTLEELVDSKIPIEGHPIVEKLFCNGDESRISRDICSRFETRSLEEIFEDIKSREKLHSAFTMKAEIYKNSKFLRDCETHAIKEVLLTYPTAFLAQTGAPFLDEMNVVITRLIEAGFIDLWKRENVLIKHRNKHYPKKLRVEHVMGIMLVTALGYAISIIAFCIECFMNYFNFKKLKIADRRPKLN